EKQRLLQVMQHHVGARSGIGVKRLAELCCVDERRVRHIVSDLREEGFSVCGTPGAGYFIAANAQEVDDCCRFLRKRAMHSLRLEAKLRRQALPDLINQLRFTEV